MNYEGPSSPSAVLNLLASTSHQIEAFSSSIINEVKNGELSPLRVLVQLRAQERATKQILDAIKENIITEAEKYPGKDFELWGNTLSKEDVKTEYDYTVCKDVIWEMLKTEADKYARLVKERESFLRSLKESMVVVDILTGEISEIRPPFKKSTPGVKVKIK